MNPHPTDGRSFEDRVAALPDAIGGFDSFDYDGIERTEEVEAMVREYAALGMTERLATELCAERADDSSTESERAGVLIREILILIISAPSGSGPRLVAEELRIAFGFRESNSESLRGIATRYGLTVAAVSKAVLDLQKRLNLPKNSFNKSAMACETYALTNKPSRAK